MQHINHIELTEPAHSGLVEHLENFGNVLSEDHSNALRGLLGLMTDMANGKYTGRYAAGLDTGQGKSSAILLWLSNLQQLPGGHNVAVSVAAQRIESLCEMKRDLMRLGVPESQIGLVHTYKHWTGDPEDIPTGYASEPATVTSGGEFADRPIMLVSHTRVRGTSNRWEKTRLFSHHVGQPRALMIFDESLLVAEARQLNLSAFGSAVGLLKGLASPFGNSDIVPFVIPWLREVEGALKEALTDSEHRGHILMRLPPLAAQVESMLLDLCQSGSGLTPADRAVVEPIITALLELVPYDLRLTHRNGGGLLTFEIVVPDELENILILDASYPIRRLMHEDSTIKDAEQVMVEAGMHLSKPLAQLKDYSNVTWHVMKAAGGRSSMNKAFAGTKRNPRVVTQDVAEVINQIPEDESVLLFVYKYKGRKNPDFKADLLHELEAAGIDTSATVATGQRINIATWGNETGANAWAHCKHVIMVGILQKDRRLMEALMVGQRNDLNAQLTNKEIMEVVDSESAHLAHQAASRSTLRHVNNGKANGAHIWVIHQRTKELRAYVSRVQSTAKWVEWHGAYSQSKESKAVGMAGKVRDYLSGLPEDVHKVSAMRVKKDLSLGKVATGTWQRAREAAMGELVFSWSMQGASFVRIED